MDKENLNKTVKAAQNGDDAARQTLYINFSKRVYYLALKLMKNHEDAEDVMQEVFITAFEKLSELREVETFPHWLNRITANKCTNELKKRKVAFDTDMSELEDVLDFTEEKDPLLIPEKSLDNAETSRMITAIIDELPLPQRLCIYYYYYENLTVAQIAENLGANESTIRSRLALAREKIRKELERLDKEEGTKLYGVPLLLAPVLSQSLNLFDMPQGLADGTWAKIAAAISAKTVVTVKAAAAAKAAKAAGLGIKAKIMIAAAGIAIAASVAAAVVLYVPLLNPIEEPEIVTRESKSSESISEESNESRETGESGESDDYQISTSTKIVEEEIENMETPKFGGYDWIVLEERDGKALILSKNVIAVKAFHYSGESRYITWENCYLREWLNGEFFDTLFSEEEKARILETEVVNETNQFWNTDAGNDTVDKLFLLSIREVVVYLKDESLAFSGGDPSEYRVLIDNEYNSRRVALGDPDIIILEDDLAVWYREEVLSGGGTRWWLRDPGEEHYVRPWVHDDGIVYFCGDPNVDWAGGVRPAMWVALDSD